MKNIIYLTLIVLILAGCDKKYVYIEYKAEDTGTTQKAEVIKAKNDTMAVNMAYEKFYKILLAEYKTRQLLKDKNVPNFSEYVAFDIYDKKGIDLKNRLDYITQVEQKEKALDKLEHIFGKFPDEITNKMELIEAGIYTPKIYKFGF